MEYFRYEWYDPYTGRTDPEQYSTLSYGDFVSCKLEKDCNRKNIYIMPAECSGSDYSGGNIFRSEQ